MLTDVSMYDLGYCASIYASIYSSLLAVLIMILIRSIDGDNCDNGSVVTMIICLCVAPLPMPLILVFCSILC